MSDTISRFSDRVVNYVKFRPHYPAEVLSFLAEKASLTPTSVVADIGCGTGISSKLFLENGNPVFGVEPNEAMRLAAIEYLKEFPAFTPIDGTSTATTLDGASVDLIVAAQAYHWFDPEPTRNEFKRVLKAGGSAVLIWNERQLDTTLFLEEYEALLLKYANDYGQVRHENISNTEISAFYKAPFDSATFPNEQVFDLDSLKGRMLSSSYMPTENDPRFPALVGELQAVFAKHAENGRIRVLYDTRVYTSQF